MYYSPFMERSCRYRTQSIERDNRREDSRNRYSGRKESRDLEIGAVIVEINTIVGKHVINAALTILMLDTVIKLDVMNVGNLDILV